MNGSQGGSSVGVVDGVTEGTDVGANTVFVGRIVGVTTTAGGSVAGVVVQDTRISSRRELNICFITISIAVEQ